MWRSTKINLVNEVVIAIRGSLDGNGREIVKEIFVQLLEVAYALDEEVSRMIGDDFSLKGRAAEVNGNTLRPKRVGFAHLARSRPRNMVLLRPATEFAG